MQKCFSTLLILLFFTMSLLSQQSEIIVKGTVEYPVEGSDIKIWQIVDKSKTLTDSISVSFDKTFQKTVKLPAPGLYEIGYERWEKVSFWGENENIEINFSGRDTANMLVLTTPYRHIGGAGENNELMNLVNYSDYRTQQARSIAIKDLNTARKSGSKEWEKGVMDGYRQTQATGADNIDYLAKHYCHLNSVMALLPRIQSEAIQNEVLDYLEQTKPNYSPYVKYKQKVAEKEKMLKNIAVGLTAPAFTYIYADDKQGNNLNEFKRKYLLIDFWASWCGPCRKSIPLLKELYEEYSSRGFEIVSVSIDSKKENWLKALDEENMSWPQLFTEDVGKEVMDKYQFGYIPYLVLIDKEGKIVERDISVDNLKKKLEEEL